MPSTPSPTCRTDRHQRRSLSKEFLDTPAAKEHAEEAADIERTLRQYGVEPDRVAPTMDFAGHVRLNFDAIALILDMLDLAYQGKPPDLEKI